MAKERTEVRITVETREPGGEWQQQATFPLIGDQRLIALPGTNARAIATLWR